MLSWSSPSFELTGPSLKTGTTYLDYNATAVMRPAARAAVISAMSMTGNASSVHRFGAMARRTIDKARVSLSGYIGADPAEIVFTSGGTEGNVTAINATSRCLIVSSIEHDSVLVPALRRSKALMVAPTDARGVIDLAALDRLLARNSSPAIVSLMLANNETGVIQPVQEAASLSHHYGALLHCDAVQALGKISIDVRSLGADLLTLSAHKVGGPHGVGLLWIRAGTDFDPLLYGGGQEFFRRAGSENVAAINGFAAAVEDIDSDEQKLMARHRDGLENDLISIAPIEIFGLGASRLPNTLCFALPGLSQESQLVALDSDGIAVSAGSACSSGKIAESHVLTAMGVPQDLSSCAIRVSVGWSTTDIDLQLFFNSWSKLYSSTQCAEGNAA